MHAYAGICGHAQAGGREAGMHMRDLPLHMQHMQGMSGICKVFQCRCNAIILYICTGSRSAANTGHAQAGGREAGRHMRDMHMHMHMQQPIQFQSQFSHRSMPLA